MKLHNARQISLFKHLPAEGNRRRDALEAKKFFEVLPNHLPVDDVNSGSDPPDFEIRLGKRVIAAELTRLLPAPVGARGFPKIGEFKQWEETKEENGSSKRVFDWGRFSARECLAAFQRSVEEKAARAGSYKLGFAEAWLLFNCAKGNPAGALVHDAFSATHGHPEWVLDCAGKFLFEMNTICRKAAPFSYVVLFSGLRMIAFPVGESLYPLPGPNAELLQRGASASDDYLNRPQSMSSFSECRRWDPAQGAFATWLKKQSEEVP